MNYIRILVCMLCITYSLSSAERAVVSPAITVRNLVMQTTRSQQALSRGMSYGNVHATTWWQRLCCCFCGK